MNQRGVIVPTEQFASAALIDFCKLLEARGYDSLWLPELFGTEARATAFAFCTSVGRFIGAGVNFGLAGAVAAMGTLGTPIALTAIAFGVGLLVIPFARETRGQTLPD